VVILWPVAQSFWNSLFDYRLNDPTRSEKMIESHIDLETYMDDHFYLESQLEDLASEGEGDDPEASEELSADIEDYHSELMSDEEIKEKADEIDELLTNYEPVKDSDLKYQKVDGDFAEDYREALVSSEEKMNELAENSSDEELQSDYEQTADLLESSGESI